MSADRGAVRAIAASPRGWLGLLALLAVAATQRGPITSIPPQVEALRADLGLTLGQFGLLTTIPLLCFALAAGIPRTRFARRHSPDTAVMAALAVLAVAIAVRTLGSVPALFIGTVLVGIGIATLNVTSPVIVRRDFPNAITTIMPVYTAILAVMSSVGAGMSIPVSAATTGDWRGGTVVWIGFALGALVLWLVARGRSTAAPVTMDVSGAGSVLRDRRAWMLTLYMGAHSAVFYTSVAWLPKMLIDWDYSAATSGALLGYTQFMGFVFTLAVPLALGRGADQRLAVAATAIAPLVGFIGLSFGPSAFTIVFLTLLGVGHASLAVTLVLIATTAHSVARTAPLSAMVQGFGYAIAAVGPIAVGRLHEQIADWSMPLLALAVLCAVQLATGVAAARPTER